MGETGAGDPGDAKRRKDGIEKQKGEGKSRAGFEYARTARTLIRPLRKAKTK